MRVDVAAEREPQPLRCVECGALADEDAHGWRAYLADLYEVAVDCPACVRREFSEP